MDRRWQHALAAIVLTVALGAHLTGCPKPPMPPVVNPPDASDAAPPPGPVNCTAATNHRAQLGCASQGGFLGICLSVNDQRFSDCVAAEPSCAAMDSCDPALLGTAPQTGAPHPHGR